MDRLDAILFIMILMLLYTLAYITGVNAGKKDDEKNRR